MCSWCIQLIASSPAICAYRSCMPQHPSKEALNFCLNYIYCISFRHKYRITAKCKFPTRNGAPETRMFQHISCMHQAWNTTAMHEPYCSMHGDMKHAWTMHVLKNWHHLCIKHACDRYTMHEILNHILHLDHAYYMHEVPHYIIPIRSSCLQIWKRWDWEKASVLKGKSPSLT